MATVIKNLNMNFDGYQALKNINLTISDGEFVAILGPSGCGKTTLLRLLAGFLKPTDGVIKIDNSVVADSKKITSPNKRNIGMVFQSYALWPHMTVKQQVTFPMQHSIFSKYKTQKKREERTDAVLKLVNMQTMGDRYPSELSGGQKQRVAIARALANEPDLLLMDEPLSNLDAQLKIEMRREISNLHKSVGGTVLYVTHDQSEALGMADKIVVMSQGEIQQIGTPKEIFYNPVNPFVAQFVGQSNLIRGSWDGDEFTYGEGEKITDYEMNDSFKAENLYPVKADGLEIVGQDESHFRGIVKEVEFQGFQNKIILEMQDNNHLQVFACADEEVRQGEMYGVRIKKRKNVEI